MFAALAIILIAIASGCVGGQTEVSPMGTALTSPAFEDGGPIPRQYGYKEDNVNPPLVISSIPADARSLVIIVDDPDAVAPAGKVWVHWAMWNIPPTTTEIGEGEVPEGAVEGTTDFGSAGYGGPAPPDREHTYVFRLYALDTGLNLPEGSTKAQVENAMKGHVLAQAQLRGRYAP